MPPHTIPPMSKLSTLMSDYTSFTTSHNIFCDMSDSHTKHLTTILHMQTNSTPTHFSVMFAIAVPMFQDLLWPSPPSPPMPAPSWFLWHQNKAHFCLGHTYSHSVYLFKTTLSKTSPSSALLIMHLKPILYIYIHSFHCIFISPFSISKP